MLTYKFLPVCHLKIERFKYTLPHRKSMKCVMCGKDIISMRSNQKYCSFSCRDKAKYLRHKDKIKKRCLNYYHNNKEKVLEYQTRRWSEKMKHDPKFRERRQFRDKSRLRGGIKNLEKSCVCSDCGCNKDLHRHHPSYNSLEYIILCRKCHNDTHEEIKSNSPLPI